MPKLGINAGRARGAGCRRIGGVSSIALAAMLAAPLAFSGAGQALAAAAAVDSDSGTVAEVVVTAEFREQSLQKTPLSITALNSQMLEQRSITNVVEVAQAAPNVTMMVGGAGFGKSNQAFIRGIGQNDFSYAFEPRVGFYIDDVYYSTVFGSVFDLLDVERVEVMRGPQGTLNGRNSVGGAIRIFSKKPRGDGSGYLEGTYGSFKNEGVKGAVDLAIVPDKLMVRIAAGAHRKDGWVDRINFACANPGVAGILPGTGLAGSTGPGNTRNGCKVGTLGGDNVWDTRIQLRYTPSEAVEDNVTFDYTDDRSEAPAASLLPGVGISFTDATYGGGRPANTPNGLALWLNTYGPKYGLASPFVSGSFPPTLQSPLSPAAQALFNALNPNDPYVSYAIYGNPGIGNPSHQLTNPPISTVRSWGVANTLDWDLGPAVHLKSITAYREYTGEFGSSQNALALPIQEVYNEVAHHQFSEEIQLTGQALDAKLDWAAGIFYLDAWNRNNGRVQTEGFSTYVAGPGEIGFLLDMFVDDRSTIKNKSAFVHGVYHFTDQLSLEGGVRYSHETKGYSYFRQNVGAAPNLVTSAPDTTIEKWNPRVALNFQATPDLLLYTSYSTGFTAGGNDPRTFFPADVNLTFGPENVVAYEAGFKADLFGHRARLNAAAFLTKYKDIQEFLQGGIGLANGCTPGVHLPGQVPCTIFYYGNGGDADIKGFEVETEFHPLPRWLVTGGLGYTTSKFTSLAPNVNPTNNPNGLTLDSPQTQVPKWKVSLATQYEVDLGAAGTLTPHVDMTYQSTVHYSFSTVDDIPTQKGYALWNARLTWRAEDPNWSVSAYVTNLSNKVYYTSITNQRDSFGTAYGSIAPPRQYGVTVRRNF